METDSELMTCLRSRPHVERVDQMRQPPTTIFLSGRTTNGATFRVSMNVVLNAFCKVFALSQMVASLGLICQNTRRVNSVLLGCRRLTVTFSHSLEVPDAGLLDIPRAPFSTDPDTAK